MTKATKITEIQPKLEFLCKALPKEFQRKKALVENRIISIKQKEVDRINSLWFRKFFKKKTIENTYFDSWFLDDIDRDFIVRSLNSELRELSELSTQVYHLRAASISDFPDQQYILPVGLIAKINMYYVSLQEDEN